VSDEVEAVHLHSEGFWTDNAPDVPASEWYARCLAGVLHDPQGESVVCLCGLDQKEWPDGLEEGGSPEVGHLPRVEGPPRLAAWGVHPTVAVEQAVQEVDGVGLDLPDTDALGVEGLPAVPVAHSVGAQALGRRGVGIDLSPDYLKQALERNRQTPLGLVG
jgi:hypothetical protein